MNMLWKNIAEIFVMKPMDVTHLNSVQAVKENAISMINGLKEMNPQKWKATVIRHTSLVTVIPCIVV